MQMWESNAYIGTERITFPRIKKRSICYQENVGRINFSVPMNDNDISAEVVVVQGVPKC